VATKRSRQCSSCTKYDAMRSVGCSRALSLSMVALMVGASLLTACGSSSNSAPNANSVSDLGSITASSTGIVVLLGEWKEAQKDLDRQIELLLFGRLVELSQQADWMKQLRAYELSDEEFTALPSKERDELKIVYLYRSSALKSLAIAALFGVQESLARGDRAWADELRIAVGRIAQANDTEDGVLIGRGLAQAIARSIKHAG
jgi:hypothetical protein